MRIVIEEAREASIVERISAAELDALSDAIIAANSVTRRGIARGGTHREDLLAFELQVGNYHSRPTWMEEIVRPREFYRLATEETELLASPDRVPLEEWTLRCVSRPQSSSRSASRSGRRPTPGTRGPPSR